MKLLASSLIGLTLLASGCATATYSGNGRRLVCSESAWRVAFNFGHDEGYATCKSTLEAAGYRRVQ